VLIYILALVIPSLLTANMLLAKYPVSYGRTASSADWFWAIILSPILVFLMLFGITTLNPISIYLWVVLISIPVVWHHYKISIDSSIELILILLFLLWFIMISIGLLQGLQGLD